MRPLGCAVQKRNIRLPDNGFVKEALVVGYALPGRLLWRNHVCRLGSRSVCVLPPQHYGATIDLNTVNNTRIRGNAPIRENDL